MRTGLSLRVAISDAIERDLETMLGSPDMRPGVRLLASMIATEKLEVKIAYPAGDRTGIFHTKVGIFTDEVGAKVAFVGSTNETWSGWSDLGNHESIVTFGTASSQSDAERVYEIDDYFQALWAGDLPDVVVRDLPSVPLERLMSSAVYTTVEIDDLAAEVTAQAHRQGIQAVERGRKRLMPHQSGLLAAWERAGRKGICDHVTGAGKTVTALAAVRDWIAQGRPVLILVPSVYLQRQWCEEVDVELKDLNPSVMVVGGEAKAANWFEDLPDQTRSAIDLGPRVVIAVRDSASTDKFLRRVQAGPHLLVVGDEMHSLGVPTCRPLLERLSSTTARLGLSATYQRAGDPEGTAALEDFFGLPLEPPFTIADAIAAGRLVPYEYHLVECELDDQEASDYDELTGRISQLIAAGRVPADDEYLSLLLVQRARVLKNAAAKVPTAVEVVESEYRPGQRWLAYCDNRRQMNALLEALTAARIPAFVYHSAMIGSRSDTLETFLASGGVLVAIKMLDEGVDLPLVTHAVILASSTNPREYVQRRGRVLRATLGKPLAYIWDLVVVDPDGAPVAVSEIERARSFAIDAFNRDVMLDIDSLLRRSVVTGRVVAAEFEDESALNDDGESDE